MLDISYRLFSNVRWQKNLDSESALLTLKQ